MSILQPAIETNQLTREQQLHLSEILAPLGIDTPTEKSQFQIENEMLQSVHQRPDLAGVIGTGRKEQEEQNRRRNEQHTQNAVNDTVAALNSQLAALDREIEQAKTDIENKEINIDVLKSEQDFLKFQEDDLRESAANATANDAALEENMKQAGEEAMHAMDENLMSTLDTFGLYQDLTNNEIGTNILNVRDENGTDRLVYKDEDGTLYYKNSNDEKVALNEEQIADVNGWLEENENQKLDPDYDEFTAIEYVFANDTEGLEREAEKYHQALKNTEKSQQTFKHAEDKQWDATMDKALDDMKDELTQKELEDNLKQQQELGQSINKEEAELETKKEALKTKEAQREDIQKQISEQQENNSIATAEDEQAADAPAPAPDENMMAYAEHKADIAGIIATNDGTLSDYELTNVLKENGIPESYLETIKQDLSDSYGFAFENNDPQRQLENTLHNTPNPVLNNTGPGGLA